MILKNIKLKNFKSFENTEVDFTKFSVEEPVLIIGENRDVEGSDSNGAAKTTIFDGVSWAIFGRTPTIKLSQDDLIRTDTDQCDVEVCLAQDDSEVTIRRRRGKLTQIDLSIDGKIRTKSTDTLTQRTILDLLGVGEDNKFFYNDFLNTVYYSMDSVKAFTSKTTTSKERMNTIARFLNLSTLDKCQMRISTMVSSVKSKHDQVTGQMEFLSKKIKDDLSLESIEAEALNVRDARKSTAILFDELQNKLSVIQHVINLTTEIEKVIDRIVYAKKEREEFLQMLKDSFIARKKELESMSEIEANKLALEKELEALPYEGDLNTKHDNLINEKDELDDQRSQLNISVDHTDSIIRDLNGLISKAFKCPSCEALLMPDKEKGLVNFSEEYLKQEEKEQKEELKKLKRKLRKVIDKIYASDDELSEVNRVSTKIQRHRDRIEDLADRLENAPLVKEELRSILAKKEEKENSTNEIVDSLKADKLKLTIELKKYEQIDIIIKDELIEQITKAENAIRQYDMDLSRLTSMKESAKLDLTRLVQLEEDLKLASRELNNMLFWDKGFPKIKRWMIDSFLPAFEEETNSFLSRMRCGMQIELDTLRKKKTDGEFKPEFNIELVDDQGKKRKLESFSKGESARIGIAVGFALRELTLNKGYNVFDFLMMDEIVDGLDDTGVDHFFNLLQTISGLKLVITHDSSLKNKFRNVIHVIKENGVSTIA